MKIVEQNDARLVLRDFPAFSVICCVLFLSVLAFVIALEFPRLENWKWLLLAAGGLFTAILLLIIAVRTEVTFDHMSRRFSLYRRGLLGTTKIEIPLREISGVGIQQLLAVGSADHLRRVVVVTEQSTVPLALYLYNDRGRCQALAHTIRKFLRRSDA
ncbi:MAG: hypothetical protein ACT4PS_19290 [Betaproteobacteria bacterium]